MTLYFYDVVWAVSFKAPCRQAYAMAYASRIKKCYEEKVDMEGIFDTITANCLKNSASANSIPPEYLLPPFLAACGHFLGKSVICPWGTWKQPSIVYTTAVGVTGTNKSAAIDTIKNAIQEVEVSQGITFQNSRINQCEYFKTIIVSLIAQM